MSGWWMVVEHGILGENMRNFVSTMASSTLQSKKADP
jgi:hypothetical protein